MKKEERQLPLVLVVDDEPDMLSMLRLVFEKKCACSVITAASGAIALTMVKEYSPDVVISDIKMPDFDGLQLLTQIRKYDPNISVVIMTGYGTIDMAVEALKVGAYDFLQKPFDKDHIVRILNNCLERTSLLRTNVNLKKQLHSLDSSKNFIGQSQALQKTLGLLQRVANTDATVLIRGESGTGKELAARFLHTMSNRKNKKLVIVNCPALPESVLESELFGFAKGAFTGAIKDKKGLFLEAENSTIVLDEIGDIPVSVQTKLLRVLQEKEIQPLGQNKTSKVNVRVVASTNQNLEEKIKTGEFRKDLFYRLNVVTVFMPNLKEMREDIPLLTHHFFTLFKEQYKRSSLKLSPEVFQYFASKIWQGNIRELRNSIKRVVLLAPKDNINLTEVRNLLQDSAGQEDLPLSNALNFHQYYDKPYNEAKAELIKIFATNYIKKSLQNNNGNVTKAAIACGIERQALQRLMRRYAIISSEYKIR